MYEKGRTQARIGFATEAHEVLFIAGRAAAETFDHALSLLRGISPFAGGGCRFRPPPAGTDAECIAKQINKTINGTTPVLPLTSRLLHLEPENPLRIDAPFQRRSDKGLLVIIERR